MICLRMDLTEGAAASWSAPAHWRFARSNLRTALAHHFFQPIRVSSMSTARPGGWARLRNWRRNPLCQPHMCIGLHDLAKRPGDGMLVVGGQAPKCYPHQRYDQTKS